MEQTVEIVCTALGAASVLAGVAAYGTFVPTSGFWGRVAWHGPSTSSAVSLTFDDGPTAGITEPILDSLDALGVKATFFVIGRNIERWPELVRQMDARGHIVANHSFDHAHFALFRGPRYWKQQVGRTDDLIAQIIGRKPAFFRPPMGITTPFICSAAQRSGHATIAWSRRAVDGLVTDTPRILQRFTETGPGDILMLHDGIDPHTTVPKHRDRSATIAAIVPLVQGMREKGLNIIPLDALLQMPAYSI
jgi:peptidoglycan/xylan/chitin deacetylase (PgdA/CDA1 family)